jgi:hypothetical protein
MPASILCFPGDARFAGAIPKACLDSQWGAIERLELRRRRREPPPFPRPGVRGGKCYLARKRLARHTDAVSMKYTAIAVATCHSMTFCSALLS